MSTSEEAIEWMRSRHTQARQRRKRRAAEGEIKDLNIVAMMDMMTIILVFLLKSYSASAISLTTSDELHPPVSTTRHVPRDTVAITITPRSVMVGDRKVVDLVDNAIPKDALDGRLVKPLDAVLKREVEKLKMLAKLHPDNPRAQFNHELSVIGDKRIPYDLLLTVLYTAGQNELENYRFIVLQKEGSPAAP